MLGARASARGVRRAAPPASGRLPSSALRAGSKERVPPRDKAEAREELCGFIQGRGRPGPIPEEAADRRGWRWGWDGSAQTSRLGAPTLLVPEGPKSSHHMVLSSQRRSGHSCTCPRQPPRLVAWDSDKLLPLHSWGTGTLAPGPMCCWLGALSIRTVRPDAALRPAAEAPSPTPTRSVPLRGGTNHRPASQMGAWSRWR